uniref:Nucleocapsid protein n=1 Tax=Anisakis simplex TaxID=6269 RepID=A0A0M3JH61_ANISI
LSSHAHTYLTALNVEDAKPRFFASLIKLLTAFGGIVTSSKEKQQLNEALGDDLKVLMGNTELWKNGGTMKRFNSASQTICGRSTLAALKQLSAVIGVK